MKQGLVRLLYNFCKRFMGWTLHMIMCVLLCYPVSIHMLQLLSTGRLISSLKSSCGTHQKSRKILSQLEPDFPEGRLTLRNVSCSIF